MKRRSKSCILCFVFSILACFGIAKCANAEDWTTVSDVTELKTQLSTGGNIRLGANITLDSDLTIDKAFTLDLNGNTLNAKNYVLKIKANATVQDGVGNGAITGNKNYLVNIGNGSAGILTLKSGKISTNGYAAIRIYEDGAFVQDGGLVQALGFTIYNYGNYTLNDGKVISEAVIAVRLNVDGAKMTMNGGIIEERGDGSGIHAARGEVLINGGKIIAENTEGTGITLFANTKLTINYVEISAGLIAITGNGTNNPREDTYGANVTIVINDGIFTSQDVVGYFPQPDSTTTINGGTFTGKVAGIEIRAGDVYIKGGTYAVDNDTYEVNPNRSGTTTKGTAISVAQHRTKEELNLVISGGTFKAAMPFSETNPEQNDAEAIAKVSVKFISADDGTVPSFTSTTGQMVISEDLTGFITAGIYSHEIDNKYVDNEYIQDPKTGKFIVKKKSTDPENPATGDMLTESLFVMIISASALAIWAARRAKMSSAA